MAPRERPWHCTLSAHCLTLQQPHQHVPPLPPNWETSRSGSGAATCFQAKSSLPFVLLPAMFSVISQEGCPAGARGQEVLEKTQPSFPTPSFSLLPPTLALRKTQLDRWIQDRPVVPTLPPGTEVQPPSAFPWPGHQMGFSRLAKGLTIEAFSTITFKLHVSSWTPQLQGGWGQCHPRPYKASGNLTASEFAGTERNQAIF